MKQTILSVILLIFSYTTSFSQYSYVGTATASATMNTIMALTITGLSTSINFNSSTLYTNGITNAGYASIQIKSNNTWTLAVKAQNQFFTALSQGGSANMPATVLYVKPSTSPTYTNITTSDQTIKTGSNGPESTSGNTFNIDLKMTPGFNYKGELYNIGLVFTLSAP